MSFEQNLAEIEDRIFRACQKAERDDRPEVGDGSEAVRDGEQG